MFPEFLPATTTQLVDTSSVTLAQSYRREPTKTLGIPTGFVRQGEGRAPIVLLHGFDSSAIEFRRLLPLLARERKTWAIDLLGFGFTNRDRAPGFGPNWICRHLHDVWQSWIGTPVILVGTSMGGSAALDFTLNHPECVEKLILMNSTGLVSGAPAIARWLFPPLDYWAAEFLRWPKLRQSVSERSYVDESLATEDALLCGSLHTTQPGWHRSIGAFTKAGGYGSVRDRLSDIRPPTLILWGKRDRILNPEDANIFHQAIPNSQLTWLDDCGHVRHLERPETVAGCILEFARYPSENHAVGVEKG
ncbi:MAG: alpha/beta hydrolase [Cyanobacteria bacterium P01_D01_bin.123]